MTARTYWVITNHLNRPAICVPVGAGPTAESLTAVPYFTSVERTERFAEASGETPGPEYPNYQIRGVTPAELVNWLRAVVRREDHCRAVCDPGPDAPVLEGRPILAVVDEIESHLHG